jgi:hypothetical protein
MSLNITRGKQATASRVVIYGTEGIGKSTLGAQFPKPLILDTEEGTHHLDVARVACHDWVALEGAMLELGRDRQGFETVVIDSADWAERHLIDHLLRKSGKRSIEDFGFGKGYTMLAESFTKLLASADALVRTGLHVVFVAHSQVKRTSPPDQEEGYDRYELKLTKQTGPLLREWADALLFCNYRLKVVEGADGRMKARGGKERLIYAERSAAWDAKNRYGLAAELPMSIDSLAPLFAGTPAPAAPKPQGKPLVDTVRDTIAAATTVKKLGAVVTRLDTLLSEGKVSGEEWSTLTDLANARHAEIDPPTGAPWEQETSDAVA